MRIGVFDSGVGGLSVAQAIRKAFPEDIIELVEDSAHVPYGTKTPEQMLTLVVPILRSLAQRSDVIVIACNSLTTNCITELRAILSVPLVGIEPMIKPAAKLTRNGVIAVCATPATLSSIRYDFLKKSYADGLTILEPDCSNWASMIESNMLNRQSIAKRIEPVCKAGADIIVLGCTHYHWIQQQIIEIVEGRAVVLQPEQAVIKQLGRTLKALRQPA